MKDLLGDLKLEQNILQSFIRDSKKQMKEKLYKKYLPYCNCFKEEYMKEFDKDEKMNLCNIDQN